jgi:hypothetical protein
MKKIIKLTESDLVRIVKKVIKEEPLSRRWCAPKTYNLGTGYLDSRFNRGACFGFKSNKNVSNLKYDAESTSSPFGSKDPLYFVCDKSKTNTHLFEFTFGKIKKYYNNELEKELKKTFCSSK